MAAAINTVYLITCSYCYSFFFIYYFFPVPIKKYTPTPPPPRHDRAVRVIELCIFIKSENLNRNKAFKHLTKIVLILINKYTFSHKPKNHQLTKSRAIYSLKHYITGALFRLNNWFVFLHIQSSVFRNNFSMAS